MPSTAKITIEELRAAMEANGADSEVFGPRIGIPLFANLSPEGYNELTVQEAHKVVLLINEHTIANPAIPEILFRLDRREKLIDADLVRLTEIVEHAEWNANSDEVAEEILNLIELGVVTQKAASKIVSSIDFSKLTETTLKLIEKLDRKELYSLHDDDIARGLLIEYKATIRPRIRSFLVYKGTDPKPDVDSLVARNEIFVPGILDAVIQEQKDEITPEHIQKILEVLFDLNSPDLQYGIICGGFSRAHLASIINAGLLDKNHKAFINDRIQEAFSGAYASSALASIETSSLISKLVASEILSDDTVAIICKAYRAPHIDDHATRGKHPSAQIYESLKDAGFDVGSITRLMPSRSGTGR